MVKVKDHILFAEVNDLLRYREDEAVLRPMETISEIFDLFRPGMPKSGMADMAL